MRQHPRPKGRGFTRYSVKRSVQYLNKSFSNHAESEELSFAPITLVKKNRVEEEGPFVECNILEGATQLDILEIMLFISKGRAKDLSIDEHFKKTMEIGNLLF